MNIGWVDFSYLIDNAMRKRSKKYIYLPLALVLYAVVMAIFGYPRYKKMGESMTQFWGVFVGSLVLSLILHLILKRREKNRDKFMN